MLSCPNGDGQPIVVVESRFHDPQNHGLEAMAIGESGMATYLKAGKHLWTKTSSTHDYQKTRQSILYVTKCINVLLIFHHVAKKSAMLI